MTRDEVANGNGPTGSRASSPGGSLGSFTQQYSAKKLISVTPFKKRGRKAGTRGNRGGKACVPRPSLVITRGNDYHYGSDFDCGSDSDGPPSKRKDTELDVESVVVIPITKPESDELDVSPSESPFRITIPPCEKLLNPVKSPYTLHSLFGSSPNEIYQCCFYPNLLKTFSCLHTKCYLLARFTKSYASFAVRLVWFSL
ncbi:hypothetical protein DAPPUDRAFT_108091 [Daphnia pulex]|uniref:Uncharacterized protein n=1 Tax=Daphnia pulex TaxID=6669 RepID=E9GZ49_DAPPU|nr:hypothetical protein DAPPUDRAFT_108091 [Daphnia pulex]|eukprot:EFX75293.1 hypothetical protein DAPPUDRAFT_108091 [Daphnia pulex]